MTVAETGSSSWCCTAFSTTCGSSPPPGLSSRCLGSVAVGLTDTVGRIAGDIARWAQSAVGAVTTWAFGATLSAGLFIVLVIVLARSLHPARAPLPAPATWRSLPEILLVAGVSQIPALAPVVEWVRRSCARGHREFHQHLVEPDMQAR